MDACVARPHEWLREWQKAAQACAQHQIQATAALWLEKKDEEPHENATHASSASIPIGQAPTKTEGVRRVSWPPWPTLGSLET